MSKIITYLLLGFMTLFLNLVQAQSWERVTTLPTLEFTALYQHQNTLYTAADNKLYTSSDGIHWSSEVIHPLPILPTCITVFDDTLYVGTTDSGLYYKKLNDTGVWRHALLGLHISHFLVHQGTLHLCSQGSGVWKNIAGTWNNLTSDLPTYSYNVTKIVSVNNQLLALAGANGTFYRYDSISGRWIEDYYAQGYQPGLIMDDALLDNGTLWAASGRHLIRTEDEGVLWRSDAPGLMHGVNRILYAGARMLYVLTLDGKTNFTYLQARPRTSSEQTDWGSFNQTLPFYSYAMIERGSQIYIASNQGVFVQSNSNLGVSPPAVKQSAPLLFLVPSPDGWIQVTSDEVLEQLEVFDVGGRLVASQRPQAKTARIHLSASGFYWVRSQANGQVFTQKVVVQ